MKKILILSLAYTPFVGGAEIAIKEITDRISSGDIEFHLLTLRFDSTWPKEETIGNVRVHRIGFGRPNVKVGETFGIFFAFSKILFIPRAAFAILRLQRRENFDGLWAIMSYMLFPISISRFFGCKIPYLLTLQEGDPFEHVFSRARIKIFLPLLTSGFKNAAVVQTISTFLSGWAGDMGSRGKIVVIPNGVDVKKFADGKPPEKKSDKISLVTASRLVSKNAVDVIIASLTFLPVNISLIILGDGPERDSLKHLVEERGVSERVKFLGEIPNQELPKHLKACDIFVRPSRSEGMGNAFVEAMAASLPIVGTQVGGISDFLFDEKRNLGVPPTGVAVDVDSPEQVAEAVKKILTHPEKTHAMVENAKKLVEKNFDWDFIARRMREEALEPLLKTK